MNLKLMVAFVGGLAFGVGSATLYFLWDKKRKAKTAGELDEATLSSANIFHPDNEEAVEKWVDDIDEDEPEGEVSEEVTYEHLAKEYVDSSKNEYPQDDEPEEDMDPEEVEAMKEGERDAYIMNDKNQVPKLIKAEDFGEEAGNDRIDLFYYIEDGVLANEDDEAIDDPEFMVGDCLYKFGFNSNDEEMIFVRNNRMGADFEIKKIFSSYADTHY